MSDSQSVNLNIGGLSSGTGSGSTGSSFDHFKFIKLHKESYLVEDEIIKSYINDAIQTCKLHKVNKELDMAIVNYVLFRLTAGVGDSTLGGSYGMTGTYNYHKNSYGKRFLEILRANKPVSNIIQ